MAAKAVIPFLVAMMLLTGVCNTLLTKYQVRPSLQTSQRWRRRSSYLSYSRKLTSTGHAMRPRMPQPKS